VGSGGKKEIGGEKNCLARIEGNSDGIEETKSHAEEKRDAIGAKKERKGARRDVWGNSFCHVSRIQGGVGIGFSGKGQREQIALQRSKRKKEEKSETLLVLLRLKNNRLRQGGEGKKEVLPRWAAMSGIN